jgi:amidase
MGAPRPFDPAFGSAVDAAAAIRGGVISSVELTQYTFARIDAHQPALNAYVYQMREEALEAAQAADAALARGEAVGDLHGVPINVKESFGVQGRPCTWGLPAFAHTQASAHATAVQRLLDAGAILLGATNVPTTLMDGQAFNDIYGTTNSPWDLGRTPGGSSGGTAASLAAGLAFLSIGSDIGGSIRSPASLSGIYGHKPTLDVVPLTGHQPGGGATPPGFSTLLAVAGPMGRFAEDMALGLRVLGGLEGADARALRWSVPAPRHTELREFRIGVVLEDPAVPVSSETTAVLADAVRACERAGATVTHGWPAGIRFEALIDTYLFHLGAFDYSMTPEEARPAMRAMLPGRPPAIGAGALSTFADWQARNLERLACRALWERYFADVDVFLLPTTPTTAFAHDRTHADVRTIPFPEGGSHPFWDFLSYIAPATLTGCPATTAPVGLSRSGLPVGLQIMAPYQDDLTSIAFAQALAREIGGFRPPPGYDGPARA